MMKRNNLKKNIAALMAMLMTVSSSDSIQMINIINAEDKNPSESTEQEFNEKANVYIENVNCTGGDEIVVSVGIADWKNKDIADIELNLSYVVSENGLSFKEIRGLGGIEASQTEEGKITIKGNISEIKEKYRGRTAEIVFSVPANEKESKYYVYLTGAEVKNSKGQKYTVKNVTGIISASSALVPVNLSVTAVSSKSVSLSWEYSNRNDSKNNVSKYIIYRDGEKAGESESTTFTDSGLTTGEEYAYTVIGYGANDFKTSESDSLIVTPAAPVINEIRVDSRDGYVGGNTCDASVILENPVKNAKLSVSSKDKNGTLKEVAAESNFSGSEYSFIWNLTTCSESDYTLEVKLADSDGTVISKSSDTIKVDRTAPDVPEITENLSTAGVISFMFKGASQYNTSKYNIYRRTKDTEFVLIDTVPHEESKKTYSYTDKKADDKTEYYYAVSSVDVFDQESSKSDEKQIKLSESDSEIPVITLFTPESGSFAGAVDIHAEAKDNSGISKIQLLISEDGNKTWSELYSLENAEVLDYKLDLSKYDEADISIKAMAYDIAGNESSGKNIMNYHADNHAPEKVQGVLRLDDSGKSVVINWNDVSDADRDHFIVEYGKVGSDQKETAEVSDKLGIELKNLLPDCEYELTVAAVDKLNNIGEKSDVFTFKTVYDEENLTVSSEKLKNKYQNGDFDIVFNAASKNDTVMISKIVIEKSFNNADFEELISLDNQKKSSTMKGTYKFITSELSDGPVYFRAYAVDNNENKSSYSDVVEYVIDRTPCSKVENLKQSAEGRTVTLTWDPVSEEDVSKYIVYKSTGGTESIVGETESCTITDEDTKYNWSYTYCVAAVDKAGNISVKSDSVTALTGEADHASDYIDIIKYTSKDIELSHLNKVLEFAASSKNGIKEMSISYKTDEDQNYKILDSVKFEDDKAPTEHLFKADVLNEILDNNDTVYIKYSAVNTTSKKCEEEVQYSIDRKSTVVSDLTAVQDGDSITLSWKAEENDMTDYYAVYKKYDDGKYEYCDSIKSDSSLNGSYTFTDNDIYHGANVQYKVESYSKNMNDRSFESNVCKIKSKPTVDIISPGFYEVGMEVMINAEKTYDVCGIKSVTVDFGDGSADTVSDAAKAKWLHAYTESGTYNITVTAVNTNGTSNSLTKPIVIKDSEDFGTVNVKVYDTTGNIVEGAKVYCLDENGTPADETALTDKNGNVTLNVPGGDYELYIYSDGYLPDVKILSVHKGETKSVDFSIVKEDIVSATFDVKRLTLEQIKERGIDTDALKNKQYAEVGVLLNYEMEYTYKERVVIDCLTGEIIDRNDDGAYYMDNYGNKPVSRFTGCSYGDVLWRPVKMIINPKTETIQSVICMKMPEVSFTKEFFDVELLICNNSSAEFEMLDNRIELVVPDGMTLSDVSPSKKTVSVDSIPGETSKQITWILRGDTEGKYQLTANYTGTISEIGERVERTFLSDEIKVYGAKAAHIDIYVPDQLVNNDMYVKMAVTNDSDFPIYNIPVEANLFAASASLMKKHGINTGLVQCVLKGSDGKETVVSREQLIKDGKLKSLSPGCTISMIYHLTNVFLDAEHLDTGEFINFQDEVLNLFGATTFTRSTGIECNTHICSESEIYTIYDHSNDASNFARVKKDYPVILKVLKNNPATKTIENNLTKAWNEIAEYEHNDDYLELYVKSRTGQPLNRDDYKDTDKKELIRKEILTLLSSEETAECVFSDIQTGYVNAFSQMQQFLRNTGLNTEYEELFKKAAKDKAFVQSATRVLLMSDESDFCQYITDYFESTLNYSFSSVEKIIFRTIVYANTGNLKTKMSSVIFDSVCSYTNNILKTLKNAKWAAPANPMSELVSEVAGEMLDNQLKLSEKEVIDWLFVTDRIAAMFGDLDHVMDNPDLVLVDFLKVSVYFDFESFLYSRNYKVLEDDIDNKYLIPARILILDSMTDTISAAFDRTKAASLGMKYLECLVKLNIDKCSAVKAFKYWIEDDYMDMEFLTSPDLFEKYVDIEWRQGAGVELLTEYTELFQMFADEIFSRSGQYINYDTLADLSIDYSTGQTYCTFDSTYEYCFIDQTKKTTEWVQCTGERISVYPGEYDQIQLRNTKTMNIQTENILQPKELTGNYTAAYNSGEYTISGCDEDDIYFMLSDTADVSDDVWASKAALYTQGMTIKGNKAKYVLFRKKASASAPASKIKAVEVCTKASVAISICGKGKVTGDGLYELGSDAVLTAVPDSGYTFEGWSADGKLLSAEKTYKLEKISENCEVYASFAPAMTEDVSYSSNIPDAVVTRTAVVAGSDVIYDVYSTIPDSMTDIVFSHWEDENGNVLSVSEHFVYSGTEYKTLIAVYVNKGE